MAMDVGGAKGGLKADINVTPLVDVMLVLLIIMMLIAPMLNQGVAVSLPGRRRFPPIVTRSWVNRRCVGMPRCYPAGGVRPASRCRRTA